METYNRTVSGDVNLEQLQREINANPSIVPSCLSVTLVDLVDLVLEFAAALSADEETALTATVDAHVPVVETVDASQLPYSTLQNKLAVHSSPKPEPTGVTTYAVWVGAGDDPDLAEDESLGAGPLLSFNMQTGTPTVSRDIKFDPRHGRVWIHEAYIKFTDAGAGDYISADVVAPATPLQQVSDLDYTVHADGWLIYAGPGAGTHGLAGNPVLVERSYSKDGDWNYDGVNLTPNVSGTGNYKITTQERAVHRYVNNIPVFGTTSNFFTLSSDESAELPVALGYFLRINIYNVSNTNWNLSAIMEVFRERTYVP